MPEIKGCVAAREGAGIALRATAAADHDLTVIIPAFNEERRLPWTLRELARTLESWDLDYRVVVADDGSRDRTPTLTCGFGPRFSTISLSRNCGKGCAIRTAMLRATGRVLAFTDADLPFDLASLTDGYELIRDGQCDVVLGARDIEQAACHARRRLSRTLATWLFRQVTKRLISRKVADTQCGLKLFSLAAARKIFSRAVVNGFAFDAEVVLLVERLGLRFHRLPVNLVREYASSLSVWRDTLPMLRELLAIWWRNRRPRDLAEAEPAAVQITSTAERKQAA